MLLNECLRDKKSERNISIDLLKCFAIFLITNSHMEMLYEKYSFLATGGSIGNALFFFCSGFTLFLKPMESLQQFPNWYKRRINRIYPTLIAVAILASVFFDTHWDMRDIIFAKWYWFVSCIMTYYVAIFFVGLYFKDRILPIGILVALGSAVLFSYAYKTPGFNMYDDYKIRWLLFFNYMLLGAKMGTLVNDIKSKPVVDACLLLLSIVCFYVLYIVGLRIRNVAFLQFFSFIPLLCAVYYFYKIGASHWAERLYKNKTGKFFIRFVGGVSLEIYMIQYFLLTDKMNDLFPLNILIMFVIIVFVAYLTRCLARLISQTFKETPYEWRRIIELY